MSEKEAREAVSAASPSTCLGDSCQLPGGDWFIWEVNGEECFVVDSAGSVAVYVAKP